MKYILTEEELDDLVSKEKYQKEVDKLITLVLKYSKQVCIYKEEGLYGYCDKCPLGSFPDDGSYVDSLCNRSQNYSK